MMMIMIMIVSKIDMMMIIKNDCFIDRYEDDHDHDSVIIDRYDNDCNHRYDDDSD